MLLQCEKEKQELQCAKNTFDKNKEEEREIEKSTMKKLRQSWCAAQSNKFFEMTKAMMTKRRK